MRELDNEGTLLFLWWSSRLAVELDKTNAGRALPPHKEDDRVVVCIWYGAHEVVTYYPHRCLWKWPYQKINQFIDAVVHVQENLPQKRSLVGCSSPFMRLAQYPTALRA